MSKFTLAAIAIAAAGLATPALADSPTAPKTPRHVVHRAAVAPAPAMEYEPMLNSNVETPAATGGGTPGYNQGLIDPNY